MVLHYNILVFGRVRLQLNAHVINDFFHVVLADELCGDFEARSVLESAHKIMRTHDLLVLVKMAALWHMLMHILNHDWI